MFLVGLISWWYSEGWLQRLGYVRERIASAFDTFSIGILLSTLFSPFKQISAGRVDGGLSVQMAAFFDRLLSRIVGTFARSFMIVIGILYIVLQLVYGLVILSFWLMLPLFPFAGLILMTIGWIPPWR